MPVYNKKIKIDDANEGEAEQLMEKENNIVESGLRRSTRLSRNTNSMAEDGPPSPEVIKNKLPFIKYKGAIKYYTDANEIAEAADSIIQWMDKQIDKDIVPVSFDMEWPFSFQTGPGKSAVIQICVDEKCCYIFQLTNLKTLPMALRVLLMHPKARLHGVNIKNDIRKLSRDFPEIKAEPLIEKCLDLSVWCNEIHKTGGRWSLERLSNYICKLAMDKNKKVRMSKWHVVPLDENQLMYAAIDVYIGQMIYHKLEESERQQLQNETEFKLQNGEEAFKAVKALGETFLGPNMEVKV